jgi:hypothetical protein
MKNDLKFKESKNFALYRKKYLHLHPHFKCLYSLQNFVRIKIQILIFNNKILLSVST